MEKIKNFFVKIFHIVLNGNVLLWIKQYVYIFKFSADEEIKERLSIILNFNDKKQRKSADGLIASFFCLCLACSYSIIPQPYFEVSDSTGSDAIEFTPSNTYIAQDQDGEYWIYMRDAKPDKLSHSEVHFFSNEGFRIIKKENAK